MTAAHFTGAGALFRLAVRRDRILATAWILGLTFLAVSQAAGTIAVYPTEADLATLAASVEGIAANPGLTALVGPAFDVRSYGGATAWQVVVFSATVTGLMSYLLVMRHTRAEEESGRADLVDAAPVGRLARLAASQSYVLAVNVVLAVVTASGFAAYGLPWAGSVAIALALGAVGLVFAAVAGVAAQLTERSRTANGVAGTVLAVAFLLRAVGDSSTGVGGGADLSWLTWLSPIGWAEQVRPYAGDRWWVLLLPVALTVVLLAAVVGFVAHRDVGAGLFQPRLGAATAPPSLGSPLGLAWRLQRGAILGWSIGLAIALAAFGAIADDMNAFGADDPALSELMRDLTGASGGFADLYLAMVVSIAGLVTAGYAIQAVLRLRAEENGHRVEPLLATAVPRVRWVGGHLLCAAAGSVILLASAGLAAGLAHGLRTGALGTELPRLLGAALAQLPAVWVLAGVGAALFGLAPRAAAGAWVALLATVFLSQFGGLLQLDQWILDLAPFSHLPKLPGGEFTATPLLWLTALAVGLTTVGLAGFRRRDLTTD